MLRKHVSIVIRQECCPINSIAKIDYKQSGYGFKNLLETKKKPFYASSLRPKSVNTIELVKETGKQVHDRVITKQ